MTADEARRWLITATLILMTATFVFFIVAPVLGYPMLWQDAIRIFEIVLPVFLGYLGTAAQFVFQNMARKHVGGIQASATNPFLGRLIRGPIVVFGIALASLLTAFGYSNSQYASSGSGMTIDTLAWGITAALGLLNVTTQVAVSYLFSLGSKPVAVNTDTA
jgi:hypothetical protein